MLPAVGCFLPELCVGNLQKQQRWLLWSVRGSALCKILTVQDAVARPACLPLICSEGAWEGVNAVGVWLDTVVHERRMSWSTADDVHVELLHKLRPADSAIDHDT